MSVICSPARERPSRADVAGIVAHRARHGVPAVRRLLGCAVGLLAGQRPSLEVMSR